MTAAEINRLTRTIKHKVREQGLVLTSVGITGSNTCDPRFLEITDTIIELAKKEAGIRRVQGITVDQESGLISFSVIFDGKAKEEYETIEKIRDDIKGVFPDMNVEIETAIDF